MPREEKKYSEEVRIRMSPEEKEKLMSCAKRERRTMSEVARNALDEYYEREN